MKDGGETMPKVGGKVVLFQINQLLSKCFMYASTSSSSGLCSNPPRLLKLQSIIVAIHFLILFGGSKALPFSGMV